MKAATPSEVLQRRSGGPPKPVRDFLAVEEPLEIQIDTRPVSVTMRTPGHDEELAAGFLFSEGLITSRTQLASIMPFPRNEAGNAVNVLLQPEVAIDFGQLTRHVFASSSRGLCGKATIQAVHQHFPPIDCALEVDSKVLLASPDKLRAVQGTFDETGGLHAGLFSGMASCRWRARMSAAIMRWTRYWATRCCKTCRWTGKS